MSDALQTDKERVLLARALYFFAAWTVLIKYVLPIGWALRQGEAWTTYIYFWDAWWLFHLLTGRGLIRRWKGIWHGAFLLCAAEIIIITVKFFHYFRAPVFDFWHVNWFINKTFLLFYFWTLTVWLLKKENKQSLRGE